jgi:Kef-type K+ transport system membrane component KefB
MSAMVTLALVTLGSAAAAFAARLALYAVVPTLVLEIAVGVLLGPHGIGAIASDDAAMTLLSELGLASLMLIAGLEIDLGRLAGRSSDVSGTRPIWMALVMTILTIVIAALGVLFLIGADQPWTHLAIYTIVLSTTSVGIVVPAIQERGLAETAYGQTILATALLADFVTMVAISSLAGIVIYGDPWGASGSFFLVASAAAAIAAATFARRWFRTGRLSSRTSQPFVRAAFSLLFVFAWMAIELESELVLAAFLAGLILGQIVPRGDQLRETIEAFGYGFFVPFFFVSVGLNLNLSALLGSISMIALIPSILLIALANKIIPSMLLIKRYGARTAVSGGVLLTARLSLIIAASAVATRLGIFDEATNAAMTMVAIILSIASPVLFNVLTKNNDHAEYVR